MSDSSDVRPRPAGVPAEDRAGLGWLSLAELLGTPAWAQQSPIPVRRTAGLPGFPHFPPKAKRVIYLHMLGALSQVDTFDYKPMLEKMHGEELPSRCGATGGCRRW